MEVKNVPIEELKPTDYNPRGMTEKEKKDLTESILKFGMVEPIVVNGAENRKNVIIGGHQRFYICKELGWKEMPVVYVNIPEIEKEKELNLRLNRNLGHWDWDLLAKFDESLLKDIGFSNEELDEVFGLEVDDEFDLEKEFKKAIKNPKGVKEGDLWQLGEHKLYIGDAVKKESWEKVLGEERFDFLFTDPPYKIGYGIGIKKQKTKEGFKLYQYRTYPSIGITNKDGESFDIEKSPLKRMVKYFGAKKNRGYLGVDKKGRLPEYDEWLSIANEYQNPKGANVMVFENWKNIREIWSAIEKYWKVRNMIIWWLPNRHLGWGRSWVHFNKYDIAPLAGEGILNEEYEKELEDYLKEKGQKLLDSYEVILYGQKGKSEWSRKKGSKWAKVSDHITWTAEETISGRVENIIFGKKPIQILVPYIKILSPRDGIVMDCFGGSGSTLIACEIMKRRCRMIEIEPLYGEIIINRWEKFTKKSAIKL